MIDRLPMKRKIARLAPLPKGPPRCSEIAFHDLSLSMNAKPDRVVVNQDNLREVLECHRAREGQMPDLEPSDAGRKYVTVDRMRLFQFINDHGELRCDCSKH